MRDPDEFRRGRARATRTLAGVAAVATLLLASPSWAQFEAAEQALLRRDYNAMRSACEPAPHNQSRGCDYILSYLHRQGLAGLPKDLGKALALARQAADRGLPAGQALVGAMLRRGEGAKANAPEAARYLRAALAAPIGTGASRDAHRDAAFELGLLLLSGSGSDPDWKAAESVLETSARLGSAKAMAQLGNMHRLGGPNFPKDFDKAIKWFKDSLAIEDSETALHGLARMHQTGQGVMMDRFTARALYEKAVSMGYSDSKLQLAFLLDSGQGGSADRARAEILLREALASKTLHPDNRKAGEAWLARAEKGLAFAESTGAGTSSGSSSTTASVSASASADPMERLRAEEERSRAERANKLLAGPPAAMTSALNAPAPPSGTAPAAGDTPASSGPSPAELAEQLRRLQQQLAEIKSQQPAPTKPAAAAVPAPTRPPSPVVYAPRRALVIGNDRYAHVPPLQNAVADARAIARQLQDFGYRVSLHLDLNEKGFKQALRDFRQQVEGGDEVLFFFAGHGVQLAAANFLLPVDVRGDNEEQVKDEAIQLQRVLDDLQDRKVKFALAIIDACRDNPFKGSGRAIGGRGLAPTTAATGQMIMFSAGSGQQALDKLGQSDKHPNGLFTRIFLQEMAKGGQSVDRVLRSVRAEVVRLARSIGHEQTPALYDQAIGEFYFKQ